MFNSVINPVVKHCEELLASDVLDNVHFLCLVGGLATNMYFRQRMEKAFGTNPWNLHRLKLYVPSKPTRAVVLGAAYLSITRNYIRSRVLTVTYGVEMDRSLESARRSGVS